MRASSRVHEEELLCLELLLRLQEGHTVPNTQDAAGLHNIGGTC
jgi:hypothetical protein